MNPSHRLFFIPVVLLIVSLIVIYSGLNLPFPSGLFRVPPKESSAKPAVRIWASKRSGLYYCPDSKLYGKLRPGVYMSQGEALQSGYQPAGKTCQ